MMVMNNGLWIINN